MPAQTPRPNATTTYTAIAVLSTILPLLASPRVSRGEDWPQFRGPRGDGSGPAANLPLQWSTSENIRWRTPLPGEGWSSPIVHRGKIYCTAAIEPPADDDRADGDGDGDAGANDPTDDASAVRLDLVLLVIDAQRGTVEQTIRLFEQSADAPKIHSKNSHASPTVLADGQRLFVHFGHQGTACVALDGTIVWTSREHNYPPRHGNGATPILVGNRLIVTCDGQESPYVLGLDADTGKEAWRTERNIEVDAPFSFATCTLTEVDGKPLVIAPGSNAVMAMDPENGFIEWTCRYEGFSVIPKPIVVDGKVLVCTGYEGPTHLMAIDPTGSGDVTVSNVRWDISRGVPKTPSLVSDGARIYMISDDGIFTCLRSDDGTQVYRQRIGGNFSASPILCGDRIYLTSEEGVTTVVATGEAFSQLAQSDLGERTLASLAPIDGAIILRTANAIYRIESPPTGFQPVRP
jgi:outer membrane protein assembly factor BamB